MADIIPFRAFHYAAPGRRDLPRLVCPPYDIIAAAEHKKLLRAHPLNFVRVELPSGGAAVKYRGAARLWRDWLKKGVLVRDGAPAFYAYAATFPSQRNGRRLVRRGFFAGLRTVPWGRGVFPHEKTLPTHKADRLKLFKAMKVQPSSIQCLFADASKRAARLLRALDARRPWVDFQDAAGVRHRLWAVNDPAAVNTLQAALRRAPVVIADGHHRYETARTFAGWARRRWGKRSPLSNYVMTYFNDVDDPGLEILPTHRAVPGDKRRYVNLEKWGKLTPVKGLRDLEFIIAGKGAAAQNEIGVCTGGRFFRYRMTRVPPALKGTPAAALAVSRLHAGPLRGLGKEDFFFTRQPAEAVREARRQKGWAFFVAPTPLRRVIAVATAGQVMPPKSTYFYPKIPSGLVAHSLHGEK